MYILVAVAVCATAEHVTNQMACLGDSDIAQFLAGAGDASARESVDVHLDACADCRVLVAALVRGRAAVRVTHAPTAKEGVAHSTPRQDMSGRQVGRYIVMTELGSGGMGTVYAAYDPELDREIAIKVLNRATTSASKSAQDRLVREARALAKLAHSNIVHVYDVGTSAHDDVFIAMELVDGLTLREWLAVEDRDWRQVVAMFVQAAKGLVAAHASGLVHRDFKPENLLIGSDDRARIGDFGLARTAMEPHAAIGEHDSGSLATLTQTGVVSGTPPYMAPEQFDGGAVDARADQFSFFVTLHEALCGQRPFQGSTPEELTLALRKPPGVIAPELGVPTWLTQMIARGLQHDAEARFKDMATVVEQLEAGLAPTRSRRRTIVSSVLVGTLVVGAVAMYSLGRGRSVATTCGIPQQLSSAWSTDAKQRTRAVFDKSQNAASRGNWQIVERRLDEYVAGLRTLYEDQCELEDSEHKRKRRVCLDYRAAEFTSFLALVHSAADTRLVVQRATHTLEFLSPLDDCSRDQYVAGLGLEPEGKAIVSLREQIATVHHLLRLKLAQKAVAHGERTLAAASKQGIVQLQARALLAFAPVLLKTKSKPAEKLVRATALAAENSGARVLAAQLWIILVDTPLGRKDAAQHAARLVHGLEADPRLASELDFMRSRVARKMERDSAQARTLHRRVVQTWDKQKRPNYARLTRVLGTMAQEAVLRAEFGEASRELTRALALTSRYLGEYHVFTSRILEMLAKLTMERGDYSTSVALFKRLVPILRAQHGDKHPTVVQISLYWAEVVALSGAGLAESERILDTLERATSPKDAPAHELLAMVLQGKSLVAEMRKDLSAAVTLQRRAVELQRARYGESHEMVTRAWIRLAVVHAAAGHSREAIRLIRRHLPEVEKFNRAGFAAKRLSAGLGSVLMTLGTELQKLGRFDDATRVFERALTADPPETTSRFVLAMIRIRLAQVLWRRPRQRVRAVGLARQARDYAQELPPRYDSAKTEIAVWLKQHRPDRKGD